MIIGPGSLKKGAILFIGAASIMTCIFTTFASENLFLQLVGGVALIATLLGAGKIYKSMEK